MKERIPNESSQVLLDSVKCVTDHHRDPQIITDYLQGPLPTDVRADIWDGLDSLEKQLVDKLFESQLGISAENFIHHVAPSDSGVVGANGPELLVSKNGRVHLLATFDVPPGAILTGEQWANEVGEFFGGAQSQPPGNVQPSDQIADPSTTQAATSAVEQAVKPTIRVMPFGADGFEGHLPAVGDEQQFTVEVAYPPGQLPVDQTGVIRLHEIEVQIGLPGKRYFTSDTETLTLYLQADLTYRNSKPITADDGGEGAARQAMRRRA